MFTGCDTRPADVIFLLDSSFSINRQSFEDEKQFIIDFTRAVHIGPTKVQVGVVEYSFNTGAVINLNQYQNEVDLRDAINRIQYTGGGSDTASALRHIYHTGFTPQTGDRAGVPDFIVVITDGFSDNVRSTTDEARRLRDAGKIVYAIGVGPHINRNELAHIAYDQYHVALVPDFNVLHTIQSELHVIGCSSGQGMYQTDSTYFLAFVKTYNRLLADHVIQKYVYHSHAVSLMKV